MNANVPTNHGGSVPAWLRAFWEGAVRPSPTALLTALVVLLAELVGLMALVTPGWYAAGGYRYFMLDADDDGVYTTAQALALAEAPPGQPTVVVICASATRSGLSGGEELAARIAERMGQPVSVFMLCLGGMTPWEMLALADQVPPDLNGVVAIDYGVNRFARTEEDLDRVLQGGRLGFRSERAEAAIRESGREVPRRTGLFLIDNAPFFSVRLMAFGVRALFRPIDYRPNLAFRADRVMDPERQREQAERVREIQARFDAEIQENLQVLTETVALLRGREVPVVLVETPINPRFLREQLDERVYDAQVRTLRAYAAELGVPLLTPADEAALTDADFYDWAHVRAPAARDRFTAALAADLAPFVSRSVAGTPSLHATGRHERAEP